MRTFEKGFKLPFKMMDEDYPRNIVDADNNLAFQLHAGAPKEAAIGILAVLNGNKPSQVADLPVEFTDGEVRIDGHFLLELRGWGYLTGMGGLNLPEFEAADIQDDLGHYIVGKLKGL